MDDDDGTDGRTDGSEDDKGDYGTQCDGRTEDARRREGRTDGQGTTTATMERARRDGRTIYIYIYIYSSEASATTSGRIF